MPWWQVDQNSKINSFLFSFDMFSLLKFKGKYVIDAIYFFLNEQNCRFYLRVLYHACGYNKL